MDRVFTTGGRRRLLRQGATWYAVGLVLIYFDAGGVAVIALLIGSAKLTAFRWGFRSTIPTGVIRVTSEGLYDLERPLYLNWSDIRSARIRSFVLHLQPTDETLRPLRYPLLKFNERSSALIEAIGHHVEVDVGGLVLSEPNPLDGVAGHSWHSWKERGLAQSLVEIFFGRSRDPESIPNRLMRWRLGLDGLRRGGMHSQPIASSPSSMRAPSDATPWSEASFSGTEDLESSRFRRPPHSRSAAGTALPAQPESAPGNPGRGARIMRAVLLTVLGFVLSGFAAREWLAHWTLDARMVFCALISLACLFAYLFVSGSANDPERQGGGPGGPGSIV